MTDRVSTDATGTRIKEIAVETFRAALRGRLIRPGDDAYDEARKLWNGMFDRRPGLVARCAGTTDVMSAVKFARENRLQLAVRGGAHSFPGHSVCDEGLVIDLSAMKSIRVDPVARIARAEAGAKWIDFDHETQAFGLATTGGTASDTGIAGLTLGGGIPAPLQASQHQTFLRIPRIQRVPHAVAEEAEGQHGDGHGEAARGRWSCRRIHSVGSASPAFVVWLYGSSTIRVFGRVPLSPTYYSVDG